MAIAKSLKFTLFYLALVFALSMQEEEDCERITIPLQEAVDSCAPADKKDDKEYFETDKCFWECFQRAIGFYDKNDKLSLELVHSVTNSTIKNPEIREKFAQIHAICVPQALEIEDQCDMAYTYHKCTRSQRDEKELPNTIFCEEDRKKIPG